MTPCVCYAVVQGCTACSYERRELAFVYYDFSLCSWVFPGYALGKCLSFRGFCVDKPPIMLQTEDDLLHGQMALTSHAALILTDSEGLQGEAVILGVPCITLRENTKRPITVAVGANQVVGTKPVAIIEAVQTRLSQSRAPIQEGWIGCETHCREPDQEG